MDQLKELFPSKTDSELQQALSKHGSVEATIDYLLSAPTAEIGESSPPQTQEQVVHDAVCDNCKQRIVGIRYKSQKIPDYDLCNACYEKRPEDPSHTFTAFTENVKPQMTPEEKELHLKRIQERVAAQRAARAKEEE